MTAVASERAARVAAAALLIAAVAFGLARVGLVDEVLGVDAHARWVMTDFYSGGYYPVRAFLAGENPYDRARFLELYPVRDGFPPYLPATIALHLPFGLMPRAPAGVAYFATTILLTLALAWSALRLGAGDRDLGTTALLLVAAIVLLTRPGHWNLMVGQRTLVYVLGSYASLRYVHERPVLAGLGLALAMIKPTFGMPLAALMLAARGSRSVLYGAVLTAVSSGPLLIVLAERAGGLGPFVSELIADYHAWQATSEIDPTRSLFRLELPTAIGRWLGTDLGTPVSAAVGAAVLACGAVYTRRLAAFDDRRALGLSAAVVFSTMLLCVQHVGYDLLLLTWPCVAFALGRVPSPPGLRPLPVALAVCYVVLSTNWLATWSFARTYAADGGPWQAVAAINTVALVGIWLISLAAAARFVRAPDAFPQAAVVGG